MISFLKAGDKDDCIKMMEEFYKTSAVEHDVPQQHIIDTVEFALTDSPLNKIIICNVNGSYAGFCHLSFSYSCEAGGTVALIEELYIRDGFKGGGLGTAIYDYIRSEYDSKVKRYRLEVSSDNCAAIKLYEKLGFKFLPYKQMVIDL